MRQEQELDLEIIRWGLVKEGSLLSTDKVFRIKPETTLFEAFHRDYGWGYAVEVIDENTSESLMGFFDTEEEASEIAGFVYGRFDYPLFAITENTIYAVRKSYGIFPRPIFLIENNDNWVKMNKINTMFLVPAQDRDDVDQEVERLDE